MAAVEKPPNDLSRHLKRSNNADGALRPAKRTRHTDAVAVASATSPPKIKYGKKSSSKSKAVPFSVLQEEEKSFPRGGAQILTALEQKQIKAQATQDVLFEEAGKKRAAQPSHEDEDDAEIRPRHKKPRSKDKGKRSTKRELGTDEDESRIRIEGLSYKSLVPGSVVLGQVSEIFGGSIALALPNNLTGFVAASAISERITASIDRLVEQDEDEASRKSEWSTADLDLHKLFFIGQYLRAYVTSTQDETREPGKGRRKIELSLDPTLANHKLSKSSLLQNNVIQATVVSIEDHGFVMDVGMVSSNIKGFMSSKEFPSEVNYADVKEGAVFLCRILGLNASGQILKLSADIQSPSSAKSYAPLLEAPTIDAFLPGTPIELLVTEMTSSGVAGKIMGTLDATADIVHSGGGPLGKTIEDIFTKGVKMMARIICTFPNADHPRVGVSILKHVVQLSPHPASVAKQVKEPMEKLPISTIVEEAEVISVESGRGLFLSVGVDGVPGFAHMSTISDERVEDLSQTQGRYKLGSVHRARVIGFNRMDGLFILSLKTSILNQRYIRVEDIPVGAVVRGKISKLNMNDSGMWSLIVEISEGISGLVPRIHMADVVLRHPERKFKVGMSVTARVLSTNPTSKQFRLTLKKSLVSSEEGIWSKYDQISPGSGTLGTIVKLQSNGAVIGFFGEVSGFLPVSEMSEAFIDDPSRHFQVGQVINVHALSVNPESEDLFLSSKTLPELDNEVHEAYSKVQIGLIVDGTVTEKSAETILVQVDNLDLKGTLALQHLSDGSDRKNDSRMKQARVGAKLKDLVVIQKSPIKPLLALSHKASLVKAGKAGTLPSSVDQLELDQEVHGYVRNITSTDVFVQLGGDLVGLLPRSQLGEGMSSLPNFGLQKDASIFASIHGLDHEKRRFSLTMKHIAKQAGDRAPAGHISLDGDLVNPVDKSCHRTADLMVGKLTKALITSVKATQLNVRLADNVQGRVDVSEAFDTLESIKNRKQPLQQYRQRQTIDVKILGIHDARNHRFLPISHRAGKNAVYELSAKAASASSQSQGIQSLDQVAIGSCHVAFVNNVFDDYIWVNITTNIRGRIALLDLTSDMKELNDIESAYPVGSAVRVWVKQVNLNDSRLDLSAKPLKDGFALSLETVSKGMVIPARVTKITDKSLMVQLTDDLHGAIPLTELADDFDEAKPSLWSKNDIIRVSVVDTDDGDKRLILSSRPSKVLSSSLPVRDPSYTDFSQFKINDICRGLVKNVAKMGVFINVGVNQTAFVRVADLSDSFIKDWQSAFPIDKLVTGKVIGIEPDLRHIQMSLKESVISKDYVPPIKFADLRKGQFVTGKVRKVAAFGVFILLDNSNNLSGLCHISQIADNKIEDLSKLYSEGDAVKAKVLKVSADDRRISLGLKASYFADDHGDDDETEDGDETEDKEAVGAAGSNDGSEEDEVLNGSDDSDDSRSIASLAESDLALSRPGNGIKGDMSTSKSTNGLVTSGFDWTGAGNIFGRMSKNDLTEADSDSTDEEQRKKAKKRRRKPEIQIDYTGDLDAHGPRSTSDFERLLLGQPNSSSLWVQYMAFHLQLSETDKARSIAERALKTIYVTEDVERLNVWVAWMNLENAFGSDDDLDAVFDKACHGADEREICERLISSLVDSDKFEKAETIYIKMTKTSAISRDPNFWISYAYFLFTSLAAPSRARALQDRATQSVPVSLHRLLSTKFATLEFRSPNGDPEKGRTVFEGLISTYPRKWDVWDAYLGVEMGKRGDKDNVRALFERMVQVEGKNGGKGMNQKRGKSVFKRWLDWEEKHGDSKSREKVEQRTVEYIDVMKGEAGSMS